jgi:hypothetical protein
MRTGRRLGVGAVPGPAFVMKVRSICRGWFRSQRFGTTWAPSTREEGGTQLGWMRRTAKSTAGA